MIAARKGSPLAIGHGDGEAYVGSDAIALAPLTDKITYLEEGDFAVITRQPQRFTTKMVLWPIAKRAGSPLMPNAWTKAAISILWRKRLPNNRRSSNHPEPLSKRGCLRAGIART